LLGNKYAHNNRRTVENDVFYKVHAEAVQSNQTASSVCCSGLLSVEIRDNVITICSYEL
jgi:hypothetical protein